MYQIDKNLHFSFIYYTYGIPVNIININFLKINVSLTCCDVILYLCALIMQSIAHKKFKICFNVRPSTTGFASFQNFSFSNY